MYENPLQLRSDIQGFLLLRQPSSVCMSGLRRSGIGRRGSRCVLAQAAVGQLENIRANCGSVDVTLLFPIISVVPRALPNA